MSPFPDKAWGARDTAKTDATILRNQKTPYKKTTDKITDAQITVNKKKLFKHSVSKPGSLNYPQHPFYFASVS